MLNVMFYPLKQQAQQAQATQQTLMSGFSNTDQWLDSIKMGRYIQHFKEAGLLTAPQVNYYAKKS